MLECNKLKLADQLNLLKILSGNIVVADKLIRKTHETIGVIPLWKEIKVALEKLKERHDIETKILH